MSDYAKKVDVLLVSLRKDSLPNLSLEFLKEYLFKHDISCYVDYPNSNLPVKPLIVGFSAYPIDSLSVINLAKSYKKARPYTKVIVGGPVSLLHDALLKKDCIDAVCFGPGEVPLLEYARKVKNYECLDNIPGIYQRGSVFIPTNKVSLDDLVTPSYESFNLECLAPIISSKGCNGSCTFCEAKLLNPYLSFMSVDNVCKWIDKIVLNNNVKKLQFLDDNFLINHDRAKDILEYVKRKGLTVSIASRADSVLKCKDVINDLGSVIDNVSVGVESFSQSQLDRWRKGVQVSTNIKALELLSDAKITTEGFIIISDGKTTINELEEQVNGILNAPETFYAGNKIPFVLQNIELSSVSHLRILSNINKNWRFATHEIDKINFLNKPQLFLERTEPHLSLYRKLSIYKAKYDYNPEQINQLSNFAESRLRIFLESAIKILDNKVPVFKEFEKDLKRITNSMCKNSRINEWFIDIMKNY